jgi:hypothetical protein
LSVAYFSVTVSPMLLDLLPWLPALASINTSFHLFGLLLLHVPSLVQIPLSFPLPAPDKVG